MEKPRPFGPDNPHPLSVLRSELVWEGKYDEYGNRRTLDIPALAAPMQRIETVDEPRARSEAQGALFDEGQAHLDDFRNRLIWGDNRLVCASLLAEFRDSIDAVYIDPPFDVGADFTMSVPLGDEKDELKKEQSALEMVAYRDMWGKGTDSYLHMIAERLSLIHALLRPGGKLWVHLDYRVVALVRCVLDDLFGYDAFRNEVIWYYSGGGAPKDRFAYKHDNILCYEKAGGSSTFNVDEVRMDYKWTSGQSRADGSDRDLEKGKLPDDVMGLDVIRLNKIMPWASEHTGYETQKNEALIATLLQASTNEGDLVADFFCGSGTVGAVAERLSRRWIMSDLGRFAIHTSRKRLIEVQRERFDAGDPYRAFDIYNLGRYERQWWQTERLKGADAEHRRVILEFFRAEAFDSPTSELVHGRKGPAVCHVDGIDSTFSRTELEQVTQAAVESGAKELVCLAWEFEMDLGLECARIKNETGITVRLIQIPREIMEKNRKEPPPFLEMAALTAEAIVHAEDDPRSVDIRLTSFVPSLAEVPTKELQSIKDRAVKNGFDFIDFWAVDFDFNVEEPFHHDWQDYRLRKDRSLKTESDQRFVYDSPGQYVACVKVIDVFGADTSITVPVIYD